MELCYSSVQLYGINPKGPIGGKSTSEAAVGQALCVEKYNTAIRVSMIACCSAVVDGILHAGLPFSFDDRRNSTRMLTLNHLLYSTLLSGPSLTLI